MRSLGSVDRALAGPMFGRSWVRFLSRTQIFSKFHVRVMSISSLFTFYTELKVNHLYSLTLNEWFASNRGDLCYAQRTLGSPGGKHCKSLGGNVRQKVVSTSKKTTLGREQRFFAVVLSIMDLGNVDTWKVQVFIWITVKYVIKSYW